MDINAENCIYVKYDEKGNLINSYFIVTDFEGRSWVKLEAPRASGGKNAERLFCLIDVDIVDIVKNEEWKFYNDNGRLSLKMKDKENNKRYIKFIEYVADKTGMIQEFKNKNELGEKYSIGTKSGTIYGDTYRIHVNLRNKFKSNVDRSNCLIYLKCNFKIQTNKEWEEEVEEWNRMKYISSGGKSKGENSKNSNKKNNRRKVKERTAKEMMDEIDKMLRGELREVKED